MPEGDASEPANDGGIDLDILRDFAMIREHLISISKNVKMLSEMAEALNSMD